MRNPATVVALGALCLSALCSPVYAQERATAGKWQVEFHAGGSLASGGDSGTAIGEFPVGAPLPTGGGTATTRAVSSWYFGDGAQLLNQVNGIFRVGERITPLDPILTGPSARHRSGAVVGVRISRELTTRLGAEFALGYAPVGPRFTDEATAGIESTRATFVTAWTALLATGATTDRNVTSTSDVERGSRREISVTGALRLRLRGRGRVIPYATAGAGVVLERGTVPSATLTGSYAFRFAGMFPMNERDSITVRVENPDATFIGILGGGVEYAITRRTGIRADVRMLLAENRLKILVNAVPSVAIQAPAFAISTGTMPSIQFSNTTGIARSSSLSGPAVTDLTTFEGSGLRAATRITAGYFIRF